MAMKELRSESQEECSVEILVGKMKVPNTKMIIGNLAKYDALIRMPFLILQQASIDCHRLTLEFPIHRVRVNCTHTSDYVRAAVVSTEEITSAKKRFTSALCVPCALTVCRTFLLIPCAWCLPTPLSPLPCTQRACCGRPRSRHPPHPSPLLLLSSDGIWPTHPQFPAPGPPAPYLLPLVT